MKNEEYSNEWQGRSPAKIKRDEKLMGIIMISAIVFMIGLVIWEKFLK